MHLAQMREEEARQREEAAARETAREESVPRETARVEPVREEPAREASVRAEPVRQEPARVDPRELLETAGLQMVETRSDRVPAVPTEPQAAPLGRPRRERTRPATAEEPLVQVETKE